MLIILGQKIMYSSLSTTIVKKAFYQGRNGFTTWKAISLNIAHVVEATKGTIFGNMAKNMTEKDFKSFFAHWSTRLEPNSSSNQIIDQKASSNFSTPIDSLESNPKPNDFRPALDNCTTLAADVMLFHPQLGELVADLGYKRVYMTSVASLARTPVWKKQRILRPERALLIADYKIKKGMNNCLPGVITLYQDKLTREIGVIDGQHRAGALMILAQRGYWDEQKRNIIVEVFQTEGEESVSSLFRAINAAEPVRLIDLPETDDGNSEDMDSNLAKSSSQDSENEETKRFHEKEEEKSKNKESQNRTIINEATAVLKEKYPEMFKPTSRCKIPHVNADVLRDDLFSSGFLDSRKIEYAKQLLIALEEINSALQKKYIAIESDELNAGRLTKSFSAALAKAKQNAFFLGMEKDWLYSKFK